MRQYLHQGIKPDRIHGREGDNRQGLVRQCVGREGHLDAPTFATYHRSFHMAYHRSFHMACVGRQRRDAKGGFIIYYLYCVALCAPTQSPAAAALSLRAPRACARLLRQAAADVGDDEALPYLVGQQNEKSDLTRW